MRNISYYQNVRIITHGKINILPYVIVIFFPKYVSYLISVGLFIHDEEPSIADNNKIQIQHENFDALFQ